MRNSLPMINLTLSYLTLNKRAKCAAFTIVELLIALALGLTLSGAITKIYLQNNASLQQDEQIARLQENARYALKMLTREIGMARQRSIMPVSMSVASITAEPNPAKNSVCRLITGTKYWM